MRVLQRSAVDIVRLVKAVEEVGPRNLSLISRLTGIPTETVRYNVRVRLPRLGFKFRPVVDEGKLGLVKYFIRFTLHDDFKDFHRAILDALARTAYLTYYATLMPHDGYMALASVPVEFEKEYGELFEELIDAGIIASCELYPLDEVWKTSTDIRGFDIISRKWGFSYSAVDGGSEYRSIRLSRPDCEEPEVDKIDLLVIKELQKDPLQPFTKMARNVHVHSSVLNYHYKEHVVARKLIPRYILTWSNKTSFSEGDHIGLMLMCREVDEETLAGMNRALRSIPFFSFEGLSEESALYIVISTIPSSWLLRVLKLVREETGLADINMFFIDEVMRYTIPYELYSDEMGWLFNREKVFEALGAD